MWCVLYSVLVCVLRDRKQEICDGVRCGGGGEEGGGQKRRRKKGGKRGEGGERRGGEEGRRGEQRKEGEPPASIANKAKLQAKLGKSTEGGHWPP